MCPTGSGLRRETAPKKPNLQSAFAVMDVDRDGKISREDLRTFYADFSVSESEEVIGSMISAADSNKDGFVEYEEFEKVLNSGERRQPSRNGEGRWSWGVMEEVFKAMDRDGDGKVGHEDLKSYLSFAGFETTDDDIKAMIRLGGGDGGGVSYKGFLKILAV